MSKWDDCNGCGGCGVNTINCTSCNGSGKRTELPPCAQAILVNRDLHELYKEAAERWARAREDHDVGFEAVNWGDPLRRFLILSCRECDVATRGKVNDESELSIVHAADCKAARILGLKREP